MKKTQKKGLALHRETVRNLGDGSLRKVAGAARVHIPLGYGDNTDPVYSWSDDTLP